MELFHDVIGALIAAGVLFGCNEARRISQQVGRMADALASLDHRVGQLERLHGEGFPDGARRPHDPSAIESRGDNRQG